MKQKQSSRTAAGLAIIRAIESSRPEGLRICFDPIARSLVNPIAVFLSKLVIDSGIYKRLSTPGTIEFITARERYIDDFLKACLHEGFNQIVILGAGFDTRAYHIPEMKKAKVIEVDHPATQTVKLKRLKKVIDPLPDNVTYTPIEFVSQTIYERLRVNGYNEQDKTLFIWQGVTPYLTSEGVDSTLFFIANHSGPGSTVIFDYFYNETLCDIKMKSTQRITQALGEQLIFGINEGQTEAFLTLRGFCDVHNVDARELERLYFTGTNAGRIVSSGTAIVSARVNRP